MAHLVACPACGRRMRFEEPLHVFVARWFSWFAMCRNVECSAHWSRTDMLRTLANKLVAFHGYRWAPPPKPIPPSDRWA